MKRRPGLAFIFHTHPLYTQTTQLCNPSFGVLIQSPENSFKLQRTYLNTSPNRTSYIYPQN
jgi:hypothetical protein